jgi:tetratricopeptide (TPR) repeat protein
VYLYNRGQLDSMEAVGAPLRAHRDLRTRSAGWYGLSGMQLLRGQVRASIRSLDQARRIDSIRGVPIPRTQDSIYLSYIDLMILQNRERAVQRFERAIATLPEDQRATFQITNFYAVSGQPEKARAIFTRDEAQLRDSISRRLAEPLLRRQRGEVLLAEGKPLEAIAEFRASEVTVDGPVGNCLICLSVPLGRAFDRASMPDSAIYWFEHYLETPAMNRLSFDLDVSTVPNISRRLGELYEAKGDRARAAAYYQKFVDLWKNADPELQPQVSEIRQRLARLRDPEPPRGR